MKKLILMLLLVVGGVMTASAADDMYLRCNLNANEGNGWLSWDNDLDTYKFTYVKNNGTEDIYTYVIDASNWIGDINFRLHKATWGNTQQIPQYGNECIWNFSDYNQATYEIWANGDDYKSDNYPDKYFTIDHASVGASEYKITLYWRTSDNRIWMTVDVVSMPAKVSSLGYSTFSCDRALDFTNVSGLNAYKASISNNKVVLTKVTGKVARGTGLLLAGSTANIPVVTTDQGESVSGNLLKATVTEQEVAASTEGAYHYFLAGTSAENIGFYNLASNATSGAGKAYLETTTELAPDANGSRAAWIFLDDETTGINAVQNVQNSDIIYDLQGRVAKTGKAGLYIKNGKKYFVK